MKNWLVIYRKSWTGTQTRPVERFATRKEAEECARTFNRFNQDQTWNAEEACVHNASEPFRA